MIENPGHAMGSVKEKGSGCSCWSNFRQCQQYKWTLTMKSLAGLNVKMKCNNIIQQRTLITKTVR